MSLRDLYGAGPVHGMSPSVLAKDPATRHHKLRAGRNTPRHTRLFNPAMIILLNFERSNELCNILNALAFAEFTYFLNGSYRSRRIDEIGGSDLDGLSADDEEF